MDLNSVSEFLDLVKNPSKYDKALKTLRDEQERLNAAIETVGKASELDKLIKNTQALEHTLNSSYNAKENELFTKVTSELNKLKAKQEQAKQQLDKAQVALNKAEEESKITREHAASNQEISASLAAREQQILVRENNLNKAIADYNEKAVKLKAALG